MKTERLIQHLTACCVPVRPLATPCQRMVVWLALSSLHLLLVVVVVSPRGDLLAKVTDGRYAIEQLAALATSIAAAVAAFASIIPGKNRRLLLLPIAPMAVWLGSLGQGCAQVWIESGPGALALRSDWLCFPAIVLAGAVPAIMMGVMLARGVPLAPHSSGALGGLAAAGLGNFGLRLFHTQDASLMVLVWQVGTVIVLSALAGWIGRYFLSWRALIGTTAQYAAVK